MRFTLFLTGLFLLSFATNGQVKNSKPAATKPVATKPVTTKPMGSRPAQPSPAVTKPPMQKASEERCVEVIRKVFKDYLQIEEGTDSHDKKVLMAKALRTLPETINKAELPLLINVWMYYDPFDPIVRNLLWPVFVKNKAISLEAINYRIKHREKWENKDTSPFTDLVTLEKRLKSDD